jgi:hypothetical protein
MWSIFDHFVEGLNYKAKLPLRKAYGYRTSMPPKSHSTTPSASSRSPNSPTDSAEDPDIVNISIDVGCPRRKEKCRLEELINDGNHPAIIERYPIRQIPALNAIVQALGFMIGINMKERFASY